MPNQRRKVAEKTALSVVVEVTTYTFNVQAQRYDTTYQIRFGNKQFSQGGGFQFALNRPPEYPADQPLPPQIVLIPEDVKLTGVELADWMEDQIIERMNTDGVAA